MDPSRLSVVGITIGVVADVRGKLETATGKFDGNFAVSSVSPAFDHEIPMMLVCVLSFHLTFAVSTS